MPSNNKTSKNGSSASTLADVATLAGVSKSTASVAFSGNRYISADTKERVLHAAKQLGYQPNLYAQRLGIGRANGEVGLFAMTIDNITWHIMSHLHHSLSARNYNAPIYTHGYYSQHLPQGHATLLSNMCRQKPEGIICNTFKLTAADWKILKQYQDDGGNLVCLHTEAPLNCDQVIFNRQQNTWLGVNYLLKAGHRKIGLCDFATSSESDPRIIGFLDALKEYAIEVNKDWLFEAGEAEEGGAVLAKKFLALKDRPTAMCVVNDMQAATFVHQLLRAGVCVPKDLSVISFDDMPASKWGMVSLTTVNQPWREMADTAVEFLLDRMQKKIRMEPRKTIFTGKVIERESVQNIS